MTRSKILLGVTLAALGGCRLRALDATGLPCPCPDELVCDPATQTCVDPSSLDLAALPPDLSAVPPDLAPPPDLDLLPDQLLLGLSFSAGALSPAFSPDVTSYHLLVPVDATAITATATAHDASVVLAADGHGVSAGVPIPIDTHAGIVPFSILATSGAAKQTYSIEIDHAQALQPAVASSADSFGTTIAVDGDTIVVGAPGESSDATGVGGNQADTSSPGSGAAFVFVRTGSGWTQQAYLKAPVNNAGAGFGFAVAISGDTVAVGTTSGGEVVLFTRSGTTWSVQPPPLTSSNPTPNDFGRALALDGDTLAVGSSGEGTNSTGLVYVFVRNPDGSAWELQRTLQPAVSGGSYGFGSSLALDGDILAVGAPRESSAATGIDGDQNDYEPGESASGAAYVFTYVGDGTWSQQAYLKPSNTWEYFHFGTSVALEGDAIDGYTLAVGAPEEPTESTGVSAPPSVTGVAGSAHGPGAVYLFTADATLAWSEGPFIKASNLYQGALLFGSSVALDGDLLAVGAPGEGSDASGIDGMEYDTSMPNAGAVYLYARSAGTWSWTHYVKSLAPTQSAYFGNSLALGDGVLAVGAPGAPGKPMNGAAYVYPR